MGSANEKPRICGVIDIGATSIRLAVAEIHADGKVKIVDALSQGVAIGQDTFRSGGITHDTINRCIKVLLQYAQVIKEYAVHPEDVRVVATSAVREADNMERFLDRVTIATGFPVKVLDDTEVVRLTYHAVQSEIAASPINPNRTLVAEIGGGISKLLMVQDGNVTASQSIRLGGLRLREMFERYGVEESRINKLIGEPIDKSVARIKKMLGPGQCDAMVGLGGDIRFAYAELGSGEHEGEFGVIPVDRLGKFAREIVDLPAGKIAEKYHMAFADAEVLGPSLLAYAQLARAFGLKKIHSSGVSLRNGILLEMAAGETWSPDTEKQVIRSAMALARKYEVDEEDGLFVAEMAVRLFDALRPMHGMGAQQRLILYLAALLHEAGLFISAQSHHKHSFYIISNSNLFGLGRHEMLLIGLVARYHRRASPLPSHEGYSLLGQPDRLAVSKMASILRVADAMDRSRKGEIDQIKIAYDEDQVTVFVPHLRDVSLEPYNVRQKSAFFEQVFGLKVKIAEAPREQQV